MTAVRQKRLKREGRKGAQRKIDKTKKKFDNYGGQYHWAKKANNDMP
jgi:hypothetical protein